MRETSGVLVRPSLGDLSTVGGASPPLEVAPSKTFGPSAVHGETDASEATEVIYLSLRERASKTKRGSGAPAQQTRWLDGSDSAGASRVEKRTDAPDAGEVGGSNGVVETVRLQITRLVVGSEIRGGTAQCRLTDHAPLSRDFERSEVLPSEAPEAKATDAGAGTPLAPHSRALAPSERRPLTRTPIRASEGAQMFDRTKALEDTNTTRADSRQRRSRGG